MGKVIIIDARFYGLAGPGRYIKEIIHELEEQDTTNTYKILLNPYGYDRYTPKNKNFIKIKVNIPIYSFKEQLNLLLLLLKTKHDLYYVPHFNIPVLYPYKLITAIPDITILKHSKEFSSNMPKIYFYLKKFILRLVMHIAVLRSIKIIVPSKTILNEFSLLYKRHSYKFILAYEGISEELKQKPEAYVDIYKKYKLSKNYILYVGSAYEHKNLSKVFEMFEILKRDYDYQGSLVLIGKKDKFSQNLYNQFKDHKDILFPAFHDKNKYIQGPIVISDDEVKSFRLDAQVSVLASYSEGFSLTGLEAMAFDVPCVFSDIPIHREVYGESVLYFNFNDAYDFAAKVHLALNDKDLCKKLLLKGKQLLKVYSWKDTVIITLNSFGNVLSKN